MTDAEILALVADAMGASPDAATIEPLGGKQGLLVCRVHMAGRPSVIFKVVSEARRRELALTSLLSTLCPAIVAPVLASEEDTDRGLFWAILGDLGPVRLADHPTVEGYVAAAQALAFLQVTSLAEIHQIEALGVPVADSKRWEDIALRVLEGACSDQVKSTSLPQNEIEEIVWSISDVAASAAMAPLALVHGDLHAANLALIGQETPAIALLDWGSAYIAPALCGLEELLWPARRHFHDPSAEGRISSGYLRPWSPMLARYADREGTIQASRVLVRMELLLEQITALQTAPEGFVSAYSTHRKLREAWLAWRRR